MEATDSSAPPVAAPPPPPPVAAPTPSPVPTLGRIVLYRLPASTIGGGLKAGAEVPAIVTGAGAKPRTVCLTAFRPDGRQTHAVDVAEGDGAGAWRWPPKQ